MSSLGFKSNGGGGGDLDLVPIVKYDARAGRVSRVDRVQGPGGWATEVDDITGKFRAVFDLENIEIGWINFTAGGAPDFRMVPLGTDHGEAPSTAHKEGFRIMLKLSKDCGGDVRELCSTAGVVKGAMTTLYDAYKSAGKNGQLPVVALKTTRPVVSGSGAQKSTNYEPVFEIVDWVPRPPDLVFKPKSGGGAKPAATPPSTGGTRAAPPAAALEKEFG